MKYIILNKQNNKSIILFFAGWGMDFNPFKKIEEPGYDYALIYDYSDFGLDLNLEEYTNIHIFAWSFGVYAAAQWIANKGIKPTSSIAINGTIYPIDDNRGIPVNIFQGTLDNLNERTLMKFNRRMCGSADNYKSFVEHQPQRELSSLKDELIAMQAHSTSNQKVYNSWDKAYISENDYIFPAENQKRAWKENTKITITLNESHLPKQIENIIISNLINKDLIKQRFEKSIETYNKYANGQQAIANRLFEKWSNVGFDTHKKIYEIGCGTGLFTETYQHNLKPQYLLLNDLAELSQMKDINDAQNVEFISGDAEYFKPERKFDYIVSASTIQWFENIPLFFKHINNFLEPKGMIVFSTFGSNNMKEVRNAFSSSLNYPTLQELKDALEDADFKVLDIDEETITQNFKTPHDLLKSIKCTGVNGLKSANPISKEKINQLKELLPHEDGMYQLTYNPIYIIAIKN